MVVVRGHNSGLDRYGNNLIIGDKVAYIHDGKILKGRVEKLFPSSIPDWHLVATIKELKSEELHRAEDFIFLEGSSDE